MPMLKVGTAAPDLLAVGMDGAKYNLQDALATGPLLLAFFKVSCPTSQFTMPFVERLHQQILERGGQIWGVSQDTSADTGRFAQEFGLSFPILIDEKPYLLSRRYGLKFVPSLFLVAPDRRVLMAFDGFSKPDMVETQRFFANHFSFTPSPIFPDGAKIPHYKPG
ncbi:MAG: peroxiredoxin family protein [Terriglobia bacterium]